MQTLVRIITNRWFVAALGLLAMAIVIWIAGPLLGFNGTKPLATEFSRLITILVVVLLWGLNQVRRHLMARRNNQQMLDGVAERPSGEEPEDLAHRESAEELEILNRRFDEAVAILKKSRLGGKHNRQYLYQLPWYVIIGPPGCGKTTALLNSGLHFPLADELGKGAVRGIGGTRNCDWWFTDEAVLIDTAGRYTTQDSYQEVDRAAWTGFLDLLKKHRRRRPINGVLVAISVEDILQQTELERINHAKAIRQRIQELHERFGIRFPIYTLFTKCDLIAGFNEFFEDLGRDERKQVWGMTFPPEEAEDQGSPITGFETEFSALEQRISARLTDRLEQERDIRRRTLIYSFPQQLSSIREVAERFLNEVFAPSRFEETPLVRGIYFTSGTQEGTPIDRMLGSMAEGFGLDRQIAPAFSGSGRSYFLNRLFREVVFPESHLAGLNRRAESQRAWLQRGAYGGAVALTLLATLAWFTSYSRNRGYVEEVAVRSVGAEKLVQSVSPRDLALTDTLPALAAVENIPGGFAERNSSPPLLMELGLYQGGKLGPAAQKAYFRTLENLFLPRIIFKLEEQLRQSADNPDFLYEALKVYLMLDDPEHFDAETVRNWLALHWQLSLQGRSNAQTRQSLVSHLDALLAQMPVSLPIPLDEQLIAQVRTHLLRVPLPQRVYDRLKRVNIPGSVPPFRLGDAIGGDASLVFEPKSLNTEIPGLFTYDGYYKIFLKDYLPLTKQLLNDTWILGPGFGTRAAQTEIGKISAGVRRLYLTDYIRLWDQLLDDIRIVRFKNIPHAVAVLNVLSGPTSPLRSLLQAVAHETTLERLPAGTPSLVQEAGKKLVDPTEKLRRLLQLAPGGAEEAVEKASAGNMVDRHFADLHSQVRATGDQPPPLERTIAMLNDLYRHMSSIEAAANQGSRSFELAREHTTGGGSVANRIKLEARRQPDLLKGLMTSVANSSTNLTVRGMRSHLNAIWRTRVLPFYERSLAGRYPLNRRTTQEATMEDFGRFFGPGGLMDDFFNAHLKDFVDTSVRTWRWTAKGSKSLGIPSTTLQQFQRAAVIRDTFFRGDGDAPEIRFDMKPVYMDTSIRQFTLRLNDQKLTYAHGPTRWTHLKWPDLESRGEVRILLAPPAGDKPSGLSEDGPWGWFRILYRSDFAPTDAPESYLVTFDIGGRKARFILRASSALNPFQLKELETFRCPSRL